jgi:hypothetical protein
MRPPEVFVRELAPAEGQRLKRLSKRSKVVSTRQRAMILLVSNTLASDSLSNPRRGLTPRSRPARQPRRLEPRGKNGKDQRSLAFAQPFGHATDCAQPCRLSERQRTDANGCRQAGGHWFEPSTIESRCKTTYVVAVGGDASRLVARMSLATTFALLEPSC